MSVLPIKFNELLHLGNIGVDGSAIGFNTCVSFREFHLPHISCRSSLIPVTPQNPTTWYSVYSLLTLSISIDTRVRSLHLHKREERRPGPTRSRYC